MTHTKLIIEVMAGVLPGTPDPAYTRRYPITSEQWDAVTAAGRSDLLAETNGKALGYAQLLMLQPDRLNWVRTEWTWL